MVAQLLPRHPLAQHPRVEVAQRGAADIKSAQPTVGVPSAEGVDLSKVEIPAAIAAVVEGDVEPVVVAKKPVRAKKAAVKAE